MLASSDSVDLRYIEDTDDAQSFLRWLGERRPVLGFDTETTGLRWWLPGFRITLAQFGSGLTGWAFRSDRFGVLLEDVMRNYTGPITGHNVFFDMHALASCGFPLPDKRQLHDTLLLSKMCDSFEYDHSLDGVVSRYLPGGASQAKHALDETFALHGFRKNARDPEEGERAWTTIAALMPESFVLYSAMDAVSAAHVWEELHPRVQADYAEAYETEIAAAWVTFEHVHRGIRVDLKYANDLYDEMEQEITVVRTQLAELGVPSPSQRQKLADKLIDEGWVPKEFSKKSGKPKLDKSVLEGLDHEVVAPLLEWSRLTKWRKAYVEAVLKTAHKGRVYPSVSVMGAKTGRQSMQNPPIHQMPSRHPDAWKIRRLFLPESGDTCVSIDYAAQEDRLSCHFSGDPALREIFDKGLDKHRYTAAGVYQKDYDAVTTSERSLVKNFSYAASYGAQDPKLAKMLGVSVSEVAVIRERTNSVYAKFAEYSAGLEDKGRTQFHAEGRSSATTWRGRRVYADQGKFGEPKYYQLVNYVNQGTGADILKEAENRIAAAGLPQHIMFALHDELLLSVPPGAEGKEIAAEVGRLMAFTSGEFSLDLPTSIGEQMPYWGEH